MNRYFIELCYLGEGFAGFQVQENANTIQAEVELALATVLRERVQLTGSSRTDTGVHAEQNYFHFDIERTVSPELRYNLNAVLPPGIAIKDIIAVAPGSHCRFDACSRQYRYEVYSQKDPFMQGRGYYFPYVVDLEAMRAAAAVVMEYDDFRSFAKRKGQAKTSVCVVDHSEWERVGEKMVYQVRANRFLRGMVRGLVGTMLRVGRGRMSVEAFRGVIERGDPSAVDFSVPGYGLVLERVAFTKGYFGFPKKD